MKHVDIYTDGACRGNPGRGGWGAILVFGGVEKEMSGGESMTTNNRMELMGAICALEALKEPCEVTLTSDSKYLTDAINKGWLESWKQRGWKNKAGKEGSGHPDFRDWGGQAREGRDEPTEYLDCCLGAYRPFQGGEKLGVWFLRSVYCQQLLKKILI